MLHLIYGTRSARDDIFNSIAADVKEDRRAYLIVPDQKALLAENALMNRLPKSAALNVDAVGFSRLSNLVCRRYGSLTYRYASEGAKVLTMYRTLKKLSPFLNVFNKDIQSGTINALCSLASELRACAVSAEDITNAANAIGNSPLYDKLSDLALIYTDYEEMLHKSFAEQADDIDTLAEILSEHDFFGDAHVYIDSFVSFTKQELTVISHILTKGTDVTVALPFSRIGAHMEECRDTRKKLMSLCAKLSVQLDEKYTEDDSHAALKFAKDNVWDFTSAEIYPHSTEGVLEVCECADMSEEISLCLAEIFKAVKSGKNYSDIAIIARNADSYSGMLDRALERAKIPFFFSKKTGADILPLTKLIISALSLHVYNFNESDVAAYIKTGLVGLSEDECDLFEEYIDRWNISGKERYLDSEGFSMSCGGYSSEKSDAAVLEEINAIKAKIALPLERFCDSLDGAKNVRDFTTAVYEYLVEMNIQAKSADPSFAHFFGTDKCADAIRLWNVTMDALDTMVDAAGDEKTTASDFLTLLRLLFSAIDIADIPSSKDQIIIGNADTIRIDERKIVIILGVVDGIFPAPVPESPTLCENERNALEEVGLSLSQNLKLRSARELYHFVRSIDFATEKAVISYYTNDISGSKKSHSFAITRLKKLFSSLYKYSFSKLAPKDKIFYPSSAKDSIGKYGKETEAALCNVLSARGEYTAPISNAKELTNAYKTISEKTAIAFHGDNMRLSQSKLDTYSDCKLKHFIRYMLSLEDTSPFEFNPANTGTFIHSVLENFLITVREKGKKITDLTNDEIETLALSLTATEMEKVVSLGGGGNARMLSFFERMRRGILLILRNLVNEFKNSSFEPFLLEYKFGLGGHKPLSVSLSDGSKVSLNGIADRIDIYKDGGKVYVRVADYKSGSKSFSESDLKKGKNLQLLIYLFSLCYVADKEFFDLVGVSSTDDVLPAGATYFVVKPPKISLNSPPDETDNNLEAAENELERKGFVFNLDTLAKAIDTSAERRFSKGLTKKDDAGVDTLFKTVKESIATIAENMRAGKIDTTETETGSSSPCKYCSYMRVCRKENTNTEDSDD